MAYFQSDWVKGLKPMPTTNNANGLYFVRFVYSFATAFATATDKIELGILPAFARPADVWLQPVCLTASNAVDIGIMSGKVGVVDAGRTVGDEFFDGVAAVGTFVRGSNPDIFGDDFAPTPYDRSIGVLMTHDVSAGAAKKLILGLSFYAGN